MTISGYTLRPSVRAALLAFLVHHNPFYLLSALCMVAGCLALNSGLSPHPGEMNKLLLLLGILNIYELILIVLGLYLIRRGIIRDGRTLLLLEAPFLVDLTFLNAEAASVSFKDGLYIDILVLTIALVKAAVVLRVLSGSRLPWRAFGLIGIELAVLFLMPAGFKWVERSGPVTGIHFYGMWWVVGLVLALSDVLGRFTPEAVANQTSATATTIRRVYTVLPLFSLVVHLAMLHWVYLVAFTAADLSPVLLGIAVALGRVLPAGLLLPMRVALPALAIIVAFNDSMPPRLPHWGKMQLTPAVVTAGLAYVTYVYCFFLPRAVFFLGAAVGLALALTIGPTFAQCMAVIEYAWQRLTIVVDRFIPRTAVQWGMAALGGAFGFLAIGAGVSFKKQPPPVEGGAKTLG